MIRDDDDYHKPGSKIGSFFSKLDITLAFLCATAPLRENGFLLIPHLLIAHQNLPQP
jgi:hypothetical protein